MMTKSSHKTGGQSPARLQKLVCRFCRMKARTVMLFFIALFIATVVSAAEKPNIVVILADDQGWGDLSINGNRNLSTPNIDSLARDGVMFEHFYVCPLCSPTRAEFLTGRYHARLGVTGVSTGQERLDLGVKTIADYFKAAGYSTGLFGKWHNGSQWPYHPNARGFDEFYGFTSGHWGQYFNPILEHNGKWVRGKGYIADDFTDHAIEFIERNKNRPFLCYLAFNTPHSPFCVPDEYWNRFKDKPIVMRGKDGDKEDLPVTRCALAMCENIDWNVGRVLKKLDELKLANNTIVIYFSDNGPNSWRWNGGMKGRKGSTDEGGVRSPFFIRWPDRLPRGKVVPEIAGAIDILPTLASLAGVPLTEAGQLDGRDLSPLLFGTARDLPERIIFNQWGKNISARTQRYRLDEKGALFDMVTDPGQKTPINNPEITARLTKAVDEFRASLPQPKEDRPFTVGYPEFPMTPLPARDGVPHGNVLRSASAPNCSYFTHWTSPEDSMTWDIAVNTSGEYEASVYYTCAESDVGSVIELSTRNGGRVEGKITEAWDPPLNTEEDRVPRKGESYVKDFRELKLGRILLRAGRDTLTLRALHVAGKQVADVRLVTLTLIKQEGNK